MEEQRARQEQEARRNQPATGPETSTTRPETINESKITNANFHNNFRSNITPVPIIFIGLLRLKYSIHLLLTIDSIISNINFQLI